MEYLIRECRKDDLETLTSLCANHAAFERSVYDSTNKKELLEFALFSASPKLFCLIIEHKNKIAGYASYTFDFSTWDAAEFLYIDCLYLEPTYRNLGIGKAVMEKIKEIGKVRGCNNIQWQTPIFNENAIRFYNRMNGNGTEKMRFTLSL